MKYLWLLVVLLLSFTAKAQNNDDIVMVITSNEPNNIQVDENLPTCDNQRLIDEVKSAISQYLQEHNTGSIIEHRKRNLVLKNIATYTELVINDFNSEQNYTVANTIINTKINHKAVANDMRLCVSEGKEPVYLLIYPEDFRYMVQIINFIAPDAEGNNFSILYTPEVKHYDTPEQE